MITLYQLRELAQKDYPGVHADLFLLLHVWAAHDPGQELSALLENTGMDLKAMQDVLELLKETSMPEDRVLLKDCILFATDTGQVYGHHILQTVCKTAGNRLRQALCSAGLDCEILLQNIEKHAVKEKGVLAGIGIDVNKAANPLLQYGRDLTVLAEEGAFDSLYDRPGEINRLLDVILRKTKGNVVITGAAGIGKSALVELFARMIAKGHGPRSLKDTRIYEINMGRVVAGTKYRGDFEKRMDLIIQAARKYEPAILYIDEMHLIWGAGRAEGVITDAANMLKPFLARGEIRIIGATTSDEYHRYIARDEALARRFQEIRLEEPTRELTMQMVCAEVSALSKHHGIAIPHLMIVKAVELTDQYIPARFQPDKTVDLLDSACVRSKRKERAAIDLSDLLEVLSKQTGRQVSSPTGEDRHVLRNLAASLKKRIIGQEHVIDRVVPILTYRRQGMGDDNRNLGTFMFAGATGVGKTELGKVIAEEFFGEKRALLHLDLGEYNLEGSVNKLIGAPSGYAGSDREGVLIKWLQTTGKGVILLDEIEKAHPSIHMLLLGLLDDGRITSGTGQRFDTTRCVVIMTTNAVKQEDMDRKNIGFGRGFSSADIEGLLLDHFPREFLGRMDDVILFNTLQVDDLKKVLLLRVQETFEKLYRKNISVSCDTGKISEYLMKFLRKNRTGARGVQRLVEKKLLQPISMAMLEHDGGENAVIELDDEFYESGKIIKISHYEG